MRGLLMIEPLYHQTVARVKTQTRRSGGLELVNGCKATRTKPAIIANPDDWEFVRRNEYHAKFWKKNDALHEVFCKPRYRVGEVLYLKEPTMQAFGVTKYRYSEYEAFGFFRNPDFPIQTVKKEWSNKLFMPAEAARAFIKITSIRCERLLDISDSDCIAEGIETIRAPGGVLAMCYKDYPRNGYLLTPKRSFLSLYKFANKVKTIPNIWVFVYEFEYLKDYKNGN